MLEKEKKSENIQIVISTHEKAFQTFLQEELDEKWTNLQSYDKLLIRMNVCIRFDGNPLNMLLRHFPWNHKREPCGDSPGKTIWDHHNQ